MNKLLLFIIIVNFCCSNNNSKNKIVANNDLFKSIKQYDTLSTNIRDGLIRPQEALKKIQFLIPQIRKYYSLHSNRLHKQSDWIFPVQGYNSLSIGGTKGEGYISSGYNFFDGNKHKAHPAHDIFIRDKNFDCIDDFTLKSVNVLSMTEGIVVSTENDWDTTSTLRGGKYIWIYDPPENCLFYYAHNNHILVKPGDIVKPGDTIAVVGRTD